MFLTILGLLFGVAGLTGLYVFKPHVDVVPMPGFERADDPTHAGLSVSNNGTLPIYANRLSCWTLQLVTDRNQVLNNVKINYVRKEENELQSGESSDFVPAPYISVSGIVQRADLLLILEYHQKWWPWMLQKRIKYAVHRTEDGKLLWLRQFLSPKDRTKKFPTPSN